MQPPTPWLQIAQSTTLRPSAPMQALLIYLEPSGKASQKACRKKHLAGQQGKKDNVKSNGEPGFAGAQLPSRAIGILAGMGTESKHQV